MSILYCLDTSSIIDMRDWYPRTSFEFVWTGIETRAGVDIIAPKEVRKELEDGDDELKLWVKTVDQMFIQLDPLLGSVLSIVMSDFQQYGSVTRPHHADPLVVALALLRCGYPSAFDSQRCSVVTEERYVSNLSQSKPPKLPNVCQHYGLKCIRTASMLVELGIKG